MKKKQKINLKQLSIFGTLLILVIGLFFFNNSISINNRVDRHSSENCIKEVCINGWPDIRTWGKTENSTMIQTNYTFPVISEYGEFVNSTIGLIRNSAITKEQIINSISDSSRINTDNSEFTFTLPNQEGVYGIQEFKVKFESDKLIHAYFHDGRFNSDRKLSIDKALEYFGKPTHIYIESPRDLSLSEYVYATKGFTIYTTGDSVSYIEFFEPQTLEQYKQDYLNGKKQGFIFYQ